MIVAVDFLTWKEAIEVGHVKNSEDFFIDGSPVASSMPRKYSAKQGEGGEEREKSLLQDSHHRAKSRLW